MLGGLLVLPRVLLGSGTASPLLSTEIGSHQLLSDLPSESPEPLPGTSMTGWIGSECALPKYYSDGS